MAEMVEPDRTIMIVSIIGLVVIWGSFFYHRYLQDGGKERDLEGVEGDGAQDTLRTSGSSDHSDGPADRSGRTADSAQEASERQKRRTVSGSNRGRKRKR